MFARVFLGWDRPFLKRATEWILEHREELPNWLVIVPTAQSGRMLREALAEKAGALLSPRFTTPGALMQTQLPNVSPDWVERVAWQEVLEGIHDWSLYDELFPEAPEPTENWAGGLATEFTSLRHVLQENGLMLANASRMLANTVEAGRWEALADLEGLVEKKLRSWQLTSRSRALANGVSMPNDFTRIVVAGVVDMPPLIERSLLSTEIDTTFLIGAPEAEAQNFSNSGRPIASWMDRTMPWPQDSHGSVLVAADPRQEAAEALAAVQKTQTQSNDTALGSTDALTGAELARAFTKAGWTAFHPAAPPVTTGLMRWFRVWSLWIADPKIEIITDLLALPETATLLKGKRAQLAPQLSRLRNDWMIVQPDDLLRRMATTDFRSVSHHHAAIDVQQAVDTLEKWRNRLLNGNFLQSMERLLETLAANDANAREQAASMIEWLHAATPLMQMVNRDAKFWLDLLLTAISPSPPKPPDNRVIDVQGWLELFYEPGRHLVLCGMNEGKAPARKTGDPWLGEAATKRLGITTNADRIARDAYLYYAMVSARRDGGRVDITCSKSGLEGEALLPSRFLLACSREELPQRVQFLFQSIEPPEAGLRWQADWQWKTPLVNISERLSATSLAAWLACPFRFYLKNGLTMQSPEPARTEWNSRDFGTIAHEVLERWGRDSEARSLAKAEKIHAWLAAELDRIVAAHFGNNPPLAVKIQTEALRQRLVWLSRIQAQAVIDGWEVIEVEHKFEIPADQATIIAKIDRIDRHRESGALRVIDYKTGRVDAVEKAHRRKITARTVLPTHITENCPAIITTEEKGKAVTLRWTNLQLPLYAVAVRNRDHITPTPCYFTLGATETDVAIHEWSNFSEADLQSAESCAYWIVRQIREGIFWPPAEHVDYDDFAPLASGRTLEEMFLPPNAKNNLTGPVAT